MKQIIRWLFGRDDFIDGEHIAHEPSLWQRIKAKQIAKKFIRGRSLGVVTIVIDLRNI